MSISLNLGFFSIEFGVITDDKPSKPSTTTKDLVKSAQLEMEKSRSEIEKRSRQICLEAEQEWHREEIRMSKVRNDMYETKKRAREEEELAKKQIKEDYAQRVLSLVATAIVDLKEEEFRSEQEKLDSAAQSSSSSSSSPSADTSSTASTLNSTSSIASPGNRSNSGFKFNNEDPQIKTWIRFATEKLCYSYGSYVMSESQVTQLLLQSVATEIVTRQSRSQQAALERSQALEQELESLRLQERGNEQLPAYNPQYNHSSEHDGGLNADTPPYNPEFTAGVGGSFTGDSKKDKKN